MLGNYLHAHVLSQAIYHFGIRGTMTRKGRILIATVSAAVALAASVNSPASAAESNFTDAKGDVRGGFDVRAVHVDNTGKWITVKSHHRNLRYGPSVRTGSVAVYLDTVRHRSGPEFRFFEPVGFDGEPNLMRVRDWKPVGDPVFLRGQRFSVNYKRDVVRFAVTRRLLDRVYDHRVGKIRVAVRTAQAAPRGNKVRVDWAPGRRQLFSAVPRG
jgi:hypothetical protein